MRREKEREREREGERNREREKERKSECVSVSVCPCVWQPFIVKQYVGYEACTISLTLQRKQTTAMLWPRAS